MDNLTHSLTGLALARTGLNRFCPRATLLTILSANAPDFDIVALAGGQLRHLELHRGYSHSLLCLPLMALFTVLIVAALCRQKLPWMKAWLLCCIGVASHLLLDWTNSYGVRLMLPFSSRWFHLDVASLYDGYILVALLFAAIWPVFARLVSREIGDRGPSGRGTAAFALVFFFMFVAGRAVLHHRAVAQLDSRLYEDAPALKVAAFPNPFDPIHWTGVVETTRDYRLLTVNGLGELDLDSSAIFYKTEMGPSLIAAKSTETFRYFLYFARFPVWSEQPVATDGDRGRRIDLTDLRFGVPGHGSFHAIAFEDSRNQVLQSWFTYGSGATLGWGRQQAPEPAAESSTDPIPPDPRNSWRDRH
jgi:inner membrane protein